MVLKHPRSEIWLKIASSIYFRRISYGGFPKSSILMGVSLMNHPFGATPMTSWKPWVVAGEGGHSKAAKFHDFCGHQRAAKCWVARQMLQKSELRGILMQFLMLFPWKTSMDLKRWYQWYPYAHIFPILLGFMGAAENSPRKVLQMEEDWVQHVEAKGSVWECTRVQKWYFYTIYTHV